MERLARPSTNGCVQVTTKVFIATARPIGEECIDYAKNNMLDGFELCDNLEEANVVICVMYDKILSEDFIKNKRCYNFHGGLLPDYRGVGIFSWVIINGDLEAGRATDFFTLATNNPFGNTNRFTDELGGSTYANNIVIDWSTYDVTLGKVC